MEKHNDIIVSANCHYALPTGLLNLHNLCLSANHSTSFKYGENV
jgi:hypothetical protein